MQETVSSFVNQALTDPATIAAAAKALDRIVESDWSEERKQLPTLLLRALCRLAMDDGARSLDGWEAPEIAHVMVSFGVPWGNQSDENVSDRIHTHWKRLDVLLDLRKADLEERLADDGLLIEPRLEKSDSIGGRGKRARYRLLFFALPSQATISTRNPDLESTDNSMPVKDGGHVIAPPARGIHYYSIPLEVPAILRFTDPTDRLPADDVIGRLRLLLTWFHPIGGIGNVAMQVLLLPFLLFYWWRLARKRLIRAPIWLQPFSLFRGNVFELRPAPTTPGATPVKLSRYVADCPICGADGKGRSSIRPASGGWEFHGRIVGRCDHAPQEHVWSFDHIARTGRFLR